MLPILTFWAMVFGTIAIWILAEWLFIREVARTWRNPLIGLAMKSLCTLIIVADIAFLICALFQTREDWIFHHGNRWNGFCWGDVAGMLFCTVITPLVSSLIALGDIFNSWTRLAKSDSMQYVIKLFFCAEILVTPYLRAFAMWRVSSRSQLKTFLVLWASWTPLSVSFFLSFDKLLGLPTM